VNRPVNASVRTGIFDRNRRCARSANAAGSVVPAINASNIDRLDWPMMSVATEDSLIPASCSSFSRRWI
jgi:hypothetical protein